MGTQNHVDAASASAEEELVRPAASAADNAYAVALGARIKTLRGKRRREDVAEELGVHVNTLGKFERGASMPDALLVARLCEITGASITWLVTGQDSGGFEPSRGVIAVERFGYVFVPLFDLHASAGHGAFVDAEKVIAMRPFDAGYIRNDLKIQHNELALLGISGSSSEPVLRSGDTVMVDRRDRDVQSEGLHLLRIDDALLVKMVQRLPGRAIRVSSTNEAYQPFEMKLDDEHEANVDILGRVRWGGVTFY